MEIRLTADLERLARRIAEGRLVKPVSIGKAIGRIQERYPRVARYWRIDYDAETKRFTVEPDEAARAKAAALDGCYILKTDRTDLDAGCPTAATNDGAIHSVASTHATNADVTPLP